MSRQMRFAFSRQIFAGVAAFGLLAGLGVPPLASAQGGHILAGKTKALSCMGCHAIEFFRWMLGRPPVKSVYCQMNTQVHTDKTVGDQPVLNALRRHATSQWPAGSRYDALTTPTETSPISKRPVRWTSARAETR